MSFRLIPVVWKHAHVSGSAKCLLLALTDYADDNGTRIYPSYRTLAYQTGLSPSYIRKLIKRLITEGYLERVRMGGYCNGRNYSNEYRLSPRWLASVGAGPT